MRREELVDLNAFATVAEEQSFTRAAAKLGTSQSALSHTRPIEEFPRRVRIGAARVWVPDLRGEEFEEAIGRAPGAVLHLRTARRRPRCGIR